MDIQPSDFVEKAAPGTVGAIISFPWLKGPWYIRLLMVFGGACAAWFCKDYVTTFSSMPSTLSGFFVGVFGMAIVAKAHELIDTFQPDVVSQAIGDRIKRWIG